ncbi:BrnA antitoxin family protein [Kushneria aurantia]|uniref:BrnA antitoxin family protein n=1 Tax=Kushneria aurantia TaxID=504092 RepID=A0ABV6G6S2_9GAMM|nr:BrnA antitoxin family protein [Kushneria aurantia]
MSANSRDTETDWVDIDEAPELTDEDFERGIWSKGKEPVEEIVQRAEHARQSGRPRLTDPKQQITLRLDPDVVATFRKTGPGWQTRLNQALRVYLEEHGAPD